MGHRRPRRGDVQLPDGRLLEGAALAVGDVLLEDLRIDDAYATWRSTHDLDRLCQQLRRSPTADARASFQQAVWGGPRDGELASLTATLQAMRVPWTWPAPLLLTHQFPRRYATAFNPTNPPRFAWETEMVPTARPARQPRAADLESLRRHAVYWYRRDIKVPPDKVWELEQVEQARTGDHITSRRHSTVIQGIQRVIYLCGLIDGYEIDVVKLR